VFNVNRKKDAPFFQPMAFMLRRAARQQLTTERPRATHRHARLVEPAPATGMRWAKPGERPPSKYAPGQSDDVIDRFDAYRAAWQAGRVKRGR
jgi:hypothetical protein